MSQRKPLSIAMMKKQNSLRVEDIEGSMSGGSRKGALARSRSIDQQIDADRQRRHHEVQLLILGGASSGKSTFIKQIRLHKGDGFPEEERRKLQANVHENLADALHILLDNMKHLAIEFADPDNKVIGEELRAKFPKCNHCYVTSMIHPHPSGTTNRSLTAPDITTIPVSPTHDSSTVDYSRLKESLPLVQKVFADVGVQKCFEKRDDFISRMVPAEEYFLQQLDRISDSKYVPSMQDVLYIRKPTLGVVEHSFSVNGLNYRVIDVAGQKSQRKKWIHFFENVTAVVFFAALSGFCESLEEDRHLNSLQDSLNTFEEVTHNSFLESTDVILFLNKKDIFEKRLKSHSIKQCFPKYTGDESAEECTAYIKDQFEQKILKGKKVYSHVSCAVNIDAMRHLIGTVLQVIVDINLRKISHPL